MIGRAQRRIFISSLYIGSATKELVRHSPALCVSPYLIQGVQMGALHAALQRHPLLRLSIILDLNRSTRPEPKSAARILAPLLNRYPDRIQISLFRSPKLHGAMAKLVPPRYNEGWGTWHAKIYGADDDVIISGSVCLANDILAAPDRSTAACSQQKRQPEPGLFHRPPRPLHLLRFAASTSAILLRIHRYRVPILLPHASKHQLVV
jgi:hypothetical protein